jgi:hypothetical protein
MRSTVKAFTAPLRECQQRWFQRTRKGLFANLVLPQVFEIRALGEIDGDKDYILIQLPDRMSFGDLRFALQAIAEVPGEILPMERILTYVGLRVMPPRRVKRPTPAERAETELYLESMRSLQLCFVTFREALREGLVYTLTAEEGIAVITLSRP